MANSIDDEISKIRISKLNDPDINLLILLDRTCCVIGNAVELELKQLRITRPQVGVLSLLSRLDKPLTLDEIATMTDKEFNSVFVLINRMGKKELVKKLKKGHDSKTYVVLTEKGKILYHKQVTERSVHLIFDILTDEEKKSLNSMLDRLRNTTSNILGLNYKPPFLP